MDGTEPGKKEEENSGLEVAGEVAEVLLEAGVIEIALEIIAAIAAGCSD